MTAPACTCAKRRSGGGGRPVAVQREVAALAGEQRVVRPLLYDAAVLEDDDQIGVADGGEAVRDDEGRPPGEERPQSHLDAPLGADVDARGRLVQDADARGGEK